MAKPRLPWFKLWATSSRHTKIAALSDRAFRVWVELLDAANEQPVRGRFPTFGAAAAVIRRKPAEVRLVAAAGLMDERADGVWMHDWTDWQRWRPEDSLAIDTAITPESLRIDTAITPQSLANAPPITSESLRIDTPLTPQSLANGSALTPQSPSPLTLPSKRGDERRETRDVTPSPGSELNADAAAAGRPGPARTRGGPDPELVAEHERRVAAERQQRHRQIENPSPNGTGDEPC